MCVSFSARLNISFPLRVFSSGELSSQSHNIAFFPLDLRLTR